MASQATIWVRKNDSMPDFLAIPQSDNGEQYL